MGDSNAGVEVNRVNSKYVGRIKSSSSDTKLSPRRESGLLKLVVALMLQVLKSDC